MNFSSRRPADLRGARHALASSALESAKNKAKAAASPPSKKRKTAASSSRRKRKAASARADEKLDAYHYIGYVPAHGRVWELDGLRTAGPLDVGEIDSDDPTSRAGWMDVVRPALQRRMQTVLQSGAEHIQYNLLAIVDDQYLRASDELEMLKRERAAIERRLAQSYAEGWADKVRGCPPAPRGSVAEALTPPSLAQVDPALLASASEAFATTLRPRAQEAGKVFAPDFGARKMEKELAILDMPERKLASAWEDCVRAALSAKVAVEEEAEKSQRAQVCGRRYPRQGSGDAMVCGAGADLIACSTQADHVRRTFDYEPFIREFIIALEHEGLLEDALQDPKVGGGTETQPRAGPSSKASTKTKRR